MYLKPIFRDYNTVYYNTPNKRESQGEISIF